MVLILTAFLTVSAQSSSVVFTNVNVVPMDKERVLTNQTVLIKNGIVSEISKNFAQEKSVKFAKKFSVVFRTAF